MICDALTWFTLRYPVSGDVTGSWFEKVSGDFLPESHRKVAAQDTKKKCHQTFRSSGTGNFGETFFSASTLVTVSVASSSKT